MKRLAQATKQKISQALKGKMRKGAAGAKSLGTKLNKIPNDTMGEMQMVNTTGVQGAQNRSRFKGGVVDKQARQGFTGNVSDYQSRQNKYMADTKKFLGGK
jgi:phage-related protein